jgi:hypothetical protein
MPTPNSKPFPMAPIRSSSLAQAAYDCRQSILQVQFRDGTAYEYGGVPLQIYFDLLQADSKGAYFNRHIRSLYPHTKCTPQLG